MSTEHELLKLRLASMTGAERAALDGLLRKGDASTRAAAGGATLPKEPPRRVDIDAGGGQTAIHPASNGQQRMWFLHQYAPESPAYCVPAAFDLRGPLQPALLEEAFRQVIRRHDILRTTFAIEDGELCQRVASESAFRLERVTAAQAPGESRRAAAERCLQETVCLPFDLAASPPFRAVLFSVGDGEHLLLIAMHHIISDGWSQSNLCRELSAAYEALATGAPVRLPPLPAQFVDYSAWQRRCHGGEEFRREAAYWQKQLASAPEVLDLPLDYTRPAAESFRGGSCSLLLGGELVEGLKGRAREGDATLFMVFLAAFDVLLFRYTGQEDLLVGVPFANRRRLEAEGLIGFFANTLVFRAAVSGDATFRELLDRVKTTALEVYEHQDMPFDLLLNLLQTRRDPGRAPLVQATFSLQDFDAMDLRLAGAEVERHPVSTPTSKFDLSLVVQPTPEGLLASMEYNTDLFAPDRAARMLRQWHALLRGIAADPTQCVGKIRCSMRLRPTPCWWPGMIRPGIFQRRSACTSCSSRRLDAPRRR